MLSPEIKFKAWLYWLTRFGFHMKVWKEDVKLDPNSWKTYFDEGYRPLSALKEDLKYA